MGKKYKDLPMVGKFGSMGGLSTLILVLASCWTGKESKNEFITCFHESWVYEFLISIGNFYLMQKNKTRKISWKKNRRFRNRENMWWAWPKSDSVVVIADATPTSSQRILISSSCYSWLHLEEKEKWRKINKSLDYNHKI